LLNPLQKTSFHSERKTPAHDSEGFTEEV